MLKKERKKEEGKKKKKKSVISIALYVRFAAKHGLALDSSVEGWSGLVWLCVLLGAFGHHVAEHRTRLACPWCENVYHTFKLKVLTYYGLEWSERKDFCERSGTFVVYHTYGVLTYICMLGMKWQRTFWMENQWSESPRESAWFLLQTSPIWFPMDQWAGIDCCVAIESCGVQARQLIPQNVNSSPEKRTMI